MSRTGTGRGVRGFRGVTVLLSAGAVAAAAAAVVAAHPGRAAAAAPSCPSATICAFTGANATGTEKQFATSAYHSAWISFDQAAGFHPSSIIDNSGSDIWVYDAAAGAGPYCAFGTPLRSYTFTGYQPGYFYLQYNVNTCATQPPAPPG